jgi:hypothetical protein
MAVLQPQHLVVHITAATQLLIKDAGVLQMVAARARIIDTRRTRDIDIYHYQ